jgi:glutaredoxin
MQRLVREGRVNVLCKRDCRYCQLALTKLTEMDAETHVTKWEELTEDEQTEIRHHIQNETGDSLTFPQIYFGKERVGGYSNLVRLPNALQQILALKKGDVYF